MADINCRIDGKSGRITLNRAQALNALTHDMILEIERALRAWAVDERVAFVLIEGEGDKAFCAGGDIQKMYDLGRTGDAEYAEHFWRDEYRLNALIFNFPKPYVSFLNGYTMGGGVGVGCHGSHRIVGHLSRIAMPEVTIGLVPDVGGSLLLARSPGNLGEFLGLTGYRMNGADAIYVGFADYLIDEGTWNELKTELCKSGDWTLVDQASETPPESPLAAVEKECGALFSAASFGDLVRAANNQSSATAGKIRDALNSHSPLSLACTLEIIRRVRGADTIEAALQQEFRFTSRAVLNSDFIEGIRAAIIDRDNAAKWRHAKPEHVTDQEICAMLMPDQSPLELH